MPISFTCPHCKVKMTVPDKFAGVKTKCPTCAEPIVISDIPPVQAEAPKPQQSGGSRDWYDKMTGGDEGSKSSLDKIHRDTNVDLSEFVTRWTGDEEDGGEPEPESSRRSGRSTPPPAASRQSRAAFSDDRPAPRRAQQPQPAPVSSGSIVFFAGGIIVVIVVVLVLLFAFKKTPPVEPTPTTVAQTDSSGSSSSNPTASAEPGLTGTSTEGTPAPTPEKTEVKTANPEELAKKDLARANDAFDRFEFSEAASYYKKYLQHDSKNKEVWLKYIDCQVRMKNKIDALTIIEEAIKNVGDTYDILRIKVNLELELNRTEDGIASYDRLLAVAPEGEKESLLLEMFQFTLMQGEDKRSKELLDKSWSCLQALKKYITEDDFNTYKEALKDAYGNAGHNAPF